MAKVPDPDREDAPPIPRPSSPGASQSLGKYRFVATLGQGGMAEVFLAVARGPAGFNKLVVIKRLRPNLAEDPQLAAMFLDEARLAARLNHKNVVQTNEVDLVDGHFFMAMEYLDGQPLHRVLGRARELDRAVPRSVILRVAAEALQGLHYAHDLTDYDGRPLGIVHRDVSPQNVFVTYDGQVKIVDFGIAKAARRAVETDTGVIKGKLSYMAPEQAFLPSSEIDRRADVFSVGVMLWEMLASRRLWRDMGDPEILASLLHDVPRLADVAPAVPPELARACDKALALAREDRYPSAAAMRAALERAGAACSAEELGAFVESLFDDQRAEIKARLARQVDLLEHDAASELLDLDRGSLQRRPRTPSSIPPSSGVRVAGERSTDTPVSATPPPSSVTAHRAPEAGDRDAPTDEPDARSRAPLFVASVLAAGAAVATYLALSGVREPPRAAAGAASASATANARSAETASATALPAGALPAGAYIHVHLAANPVEARILVDGAPLPSNPFDGKFMKDGAVHRVQLEAPGFLPQNRLVVFDKDLAVDVPLQPKPKSVDPPGMKPDPYR